jgi:hypothetical protein
MTKVLIGLFAAMGCFGSFGCSSAFRGNDAVFKGSHGDDKSGPDQGRDDDGDGDGDQNGADQSSAGGNDTDTAEDTGGPGSDFDSAGGKTYPYVTTGFSHQQTISAAEFSNGGPSPWYATELSPALEPVAVVADALLGVVLVGNLNWDGCRSGVATFDFRVKLRVSHDGGATFVEDTFGPFSVMNSGQQLIIEHNIGVKKGDRILVDAARGSKQTGIRAPASATTASAARSTCASSARALDHRSRCRTARRSRASSRRPSMSAKSRSRRRASCSAAASRSTARSRRRASSTAR